MREIKFRAWNGIDKTMIQWSSFRCNPIFLKETLCGKLKHSTPMQYTGLKDKNGVEIYEGDILCFDWRMQGSTGELVADDCENIKGLFHFALQNLLLDTLTIQRHLICLKLTSQLMRDFGVVVMIFIK